MEDIERKDLKILSVLCLISGFAHMALSLLTFRPLIILSAAFIIIALGLMKLSRKAWYGGLAVSIAGIVLALLAVPFPFGIVPIVLGALVLYYLTKPDVKPLFFMKVRWPHARSGTR